MLAALVARACTWLCFAAIATGPPADGERESFGAVELRWHAPVACVRASELRTRVERTATTPIDADAPLSVAIEARVEARPDGRFLLRARTSSATGEAERTWIADDCETLAELTVVLLGSAIERAANEPAPVPAPIVEPSPPPVAVQPPAEAPEPVEPSVVPPPPARARRGVPAIALRPSLGAEIGGLPRAGLTSQLALVLAWRWVRLEAIAQYVPPRFTERTEGAGAVVQLATFGVRGCPRLLTRWIELPMCAGLEIGAALGKGVGVDRPENDQVLWAAALLGPGLIVRAHPRLGVVLDGHVAFPLGRPTFTLDPFGTVWEAGIGGRVLLGLEVWLR